MVSIDAETFGSDMSAVARAPTTDDATGDAPGRGTGDAATSARTRAASRKTSRAPVHGTVRSPRQSAQRSAADSNRQALHLFRVGAVILLGLVALHATGMFGATTYALTILVAAAFGIAGLVINRPPIRWPWILFAATAVLWTASSVVADGYSDFRNLTRSRPLLPDLVSMPGYVLFGLAIYGLLRARTRVTDAAIVLDGLVLAIGASLVVHHTLVGPTLHLDDTWLVARLAVSAYPAAAIFLVGLAAQLAFARGGHNVSLLLVLVGTAGLVVGDVVWAFSEIGRLVLPEGLLEIPYMIVPTSICLAMLHPDVSTIGPANDEESSRQTNRPISRYVAVSTALITPVCLVILPGSITPFVVVMSVSLCLASATRVVTAMRSEDVLRARLLHRATHDELTELPSRSLLVDEIEKRLAREDSGIDDGDVALLFIDLDRFKNVNDLMGHQTGDELLVAVAARIADTVRDADLVARISGDEFVVLTTGVGVGAVRSVAGRVRLALAQPFDLPAGEVVVTASIGVSIADRAAVTTAAELLQQADTAMYESKLTRNDTTIFDASMHDRSMRRMEIERRLRHAADGPLLSVFFQPVIEHPGPRVQGFEALLRWNDPDSDITPAEFVPIAEESGLIVPIGAFVLDEACRQAAYWRSNVAGAENLYVSVNISPRQLLAADIVDTVAEALDRHGLPPSALWLEITETVMTEDTTTTAAALSGLRMLGVRLAMDDFGTGYSSLSGLQFIPVSRLKIDRKFVSGLGVRNADDNLVRCITAVAASFDLDVVAEGVETSAQLDLLAEYGCTQVQGFLYSPAVPADEVPALLHAMAPPARARRHLPLRPR